MDKGWKKFEPGIYDKSSGDDTSSNPYDDLSGNAQQTRLLYLPLAKITDEADYLVTELSDISGMSKADIRYKLTGYGLCEFTPAVTDEVKEAMADAMRAAGIPAACIPVSQIDTPVEFKQARSVEITSSHISFFDENQNKILRVEKSTRLLLIVTGLSSVADPYKIFTATFVKELKERSFEDILKKISVNHPFLILCDINVDPPRCVFIDFLRFSFTSMGQYMEPSAAVNFRKLVTETIKRARSCITDHRFGIGRLCKPEEEDQDNPFKVRRLLFEYTRYLIAASRAGIIKPGKSFHAQAKESGRQAEKDSAEPDLTNTAHESLPPPPEVSRSSLRHLIPGTVEEWIYLVAGLFPVLFQFFAPTYLAKGGLGSAALWKGISGIGMIIVGIGMIPYALFTLYAKRMIETTPTSRIRSMSMGLVELKGRARRCYNLLSGYSQTPCIYYRTKHYKVFYSDNSRQWRLVRTTTSGWIPFFLEDETGRVLIRPKGAKILATLRRQEFWGGENIWLSPELQDRSVKVVEELIPEGAQIFVLGSAKPERIRAGIKERLVEKLRLLKSDPDKMAAFDTNNDGRIDADEWDKARKAVEMELYRERLMKDASPGEQTVVERPKSGLFPFLIADTEKSILFRLTLRAWAFMIGGICLTCWGISLSWNAF